VKPLSLERQIRADLEARIRSGDWPPGRRIPTELELMASYGCSRMTVSKAIGSLVQSGLVERRKKAGSFVARPHVQTAVLEIPDIPALIASRGESYRFERLTRSLRQLDADDPNEAILPARRSVLEVSGTHFAADAPFALERRILNLDAVPEAGSLPFDHTPPGSWLLQHVPWTEARHRITAINADAETARHLGLARGRACLMVERHTSRLGEWITFARLLFPGERYDLVATFAPDHRRIGTRGT
jgi:GntR family transcriptional regulator, histidine utilization repressor